MRHLPADITPIRRAIEGERGRQTICCSQTDDKVGRIQIDGMQPNSNRGHEEPNAAGALDCIGHAGNCRRNPDVSAPNHPKQSCLRSLG
jgi:hypothetical protein